MSAHRAFRFAHAGVLIALIHSTASNDPGDFDSYIWIALAVALPTTVFRGLIADHPQEERYRAAGGFALYFSGIGTVLALAFTFANHHGIAALIFTAFSIGCFLLMVFGKRAL